MFVPHRGGKQRGHRVNPAQSVPLAVIWGSLSTPQRRTIMAMPADSEPRFIRQWWSGRSPMRSLNALVSARLVEEDTDAGLDDLGRPRFALTETGLKLKRTYRWRR